MATGNAQVIWGSSPIDNTTGTSYNAVQGSATWNATLGKLKQLVPTGGEFRELRIHLVTAPGAGNSHAFTLMVDGVASALTLTISNTDQDGVDAVNSVAVTAGQSVELRDVGASTPAVSRVSWCLIWEPTLKDEYIVMGNSVANALHPTSTEFMNIMNGSNPTTGGFDNTMLCPTAGVFKKFYVELDEAPGTGADAFKFTPKLDGVATALTITISTVSTTGTDLVNSFSVTAGQRIVLEVDPTSAPSQPDAYWGMVFKPTLAGQSPVFGCTGDMVNSALRYATINSSSDYATGATADNRANVAPACTIRDFYGELESSPGTDNTWTFTLLIGGSDTLLEIIFTDAETEENDTANDIAISAGNILQIEFAPTSTPDTGRLLWGMVVEGPSYTLPVVAGGGSTIMNMLKAAGVL